MYARFLAIAFLIPCLAGCQRSEKVFHNDAAKSFYSFAKDGFRQGDLKEIQRAFVDCFVEGEPIDRVQHILNTGALQKDENGEVSYWWGLNRDGIESRFWVRIRTEAGYISSVGYGGLPS